MRIDYSHEKPLFQGSGVMVSRKHLTVPGKSFTWGSLGYVRIVRTRRGLMGIVLRRRPTFHLMIGTKAQPAPVSMFETQDAALVEQIRRAIDTVAGEVNVQKG